ncbi:GNAT family N-acetyltransferase [Mucilaginibacter ginsenosidivorax]|uniref:GNAT family N-acetyltransferase n=1 Tax=Mucilaginibacter ginsenosidivorax TaxID=862126 RepID=A0A5B8W564_9SPHI|nr:GNAT family N-acetyltransferase [Mucilaginibacter ginsenosidivorax]QEC78801.1 GNAT family N-acetyltransferase [Mucilaginibacter ginsenosidivorax]
MSFSLESRRLIIRPFIAADEAPYVNIHMDPLVNVYLPVRTAEQYSELLQQSMAQPHAALNRWAIVERETGNFMGSCLLREFNAGDDAVIELGYSLAAPYWGKGYATEMAKLVVDYAFTIPQTQKVVAVTDQENKGSQMVLLKSGFIDQGLVDRYEGLILSYFEYPRR